MKYQLYFTIMLLLSFLFLQGCEEKVKCDLILSNINVVNVETGNIDYEMDIIIINDKIDTILAHNKNTKYIANNIKDYSGKYVIPGLWDMHVHLSMIGEESLPLFVLNGVTGVRDMGGTWSELQKWRKVGDMPNLSLYPKIKTAGPILESPQFHKLLQQVFGMEYANNRIPVNSEKQAHEVVDSLKKIGVDLIKVRTVASKEIYSAIASESKRNKIPFTGHIENNIDINFAVENRIETIEHDIFLQALRMGNDSKDKTLQILEENKPGFTPTLIATYNTRLRPKNELIQLINDTLNQLNPHRKYLSPKLIENWQIQSAIQVLESPLNWDSLIVPLRTFTKSVATKTTILAGTDSGVTGIFPGLGLHNELKMIVNELGISNLEALQSATINATRSLKLDDKYGLVKPKYKADLLILNANPLEEISNTSNFDAVVKNGTVLTQNDIDLHLQKIAFKVKKSNALYNPKTFNHLKKFLKRLSQK